VKAYLYLIRECRDVGCRRGLNSDLDLNPVMNPIEQNIDSGSAGLCATERNIDSSDSSAELHIMEQNIDSGSMNSMKCRRNLNGDSNPPTMNSIETRRNLDGDSSSLKNELDRDSKGSQWRFQFSEDEFNGDSKGF
jgi:hypothetical protein